MNTRCFLARRRKKLLEFDNVSKKYGQKIALNNLNLAVHPVKRVALLGVNGAGKNTLLNLSTGIRRPSSGKVHLLGGDPRQIKSREKLGYLPQSVEFPLFLKVSEVVSTVASHYDKSNLELIEILGVREIWNYYVGSLSGGQNRRVALLCSLISQPTLAHLMNQRVEWILVCALKPLRFLTIILPIKKAVLFSTHHMDEVEKLAIESLL